jgi:hypothetical protein
MKYSVRTHELQWYSCSYIVEADSEEEAQELIESGFGDLDCSNYDVTDQIDFESIKIIEP